MENKVKQPSKNKEENLLNEDRKASNKRLKQYSARISLGYTEKSLEEERTNICLSQGLSRYC
jgi:hypothetical protein